MAIKPTLAPETIASLYKGAKRIHAITKSVARYDPFQTSKELKPKAKGGTRTPLRKLVSSILISIFPDLP